MDRKSATAWFLFWLNVSGIVPPLVAQLAVPETKPIVGARRPALSPDGKRLAFVYRGDIWVAPAKGGAATPITQNLETDAYPLFSPAGQWIAFRRRIAAKCPRHSCG